MVLGSCVSKYSHIKANKDVNGIEATIPAISVDLLAISEMITITKAVKIILIIVHTKVFNNQTTIVKIKEDIWNLKNHILIFL